MIDWSARANAVFQQKPPTPTDKGDETPVTSVSSVPPPGPFHENAIPPEIDERINRMVRDGALEPDDADLIRARYHRFPHEWLLVLNACQAAADERGRTTTTAPTRRTT